MLPPPHCLWSALLHHHRCHHHHERLLRACPNLAILATSREPLGVAGETVLRLPGLSEAESAQLFCDRARRAQPNWALTREERPLLSLLCLRLDGLPLALELAAARLRTYPLAELVQRLEARLATLTSNHRVAEPRQQTLEASIAWSYELLSEQEKTLFYSLSVFHGGWTAEQAIALWGGDETTRERLDTLVDKSLAQTEATAHGLRYRFLETLREFALARFAEQPEAEQLRWRRAHLAVFYDLLMTVPRRYDPEAAVRSEVVRPYQDNFLPALEFCRQDQPERALIFCWHLSTFWDWFAQSQLAYEQLKLTLPLPECQTRNDDRLIALDELHYASIYTRDWDTAEWVLNVSNAANEYPYLYRQALGDIHIYRGEPDKARVLFEENLTESRQGGALNQVAESLLRLHSPYVLMRDFARALSLVEESESVNAPFGESSPGHYRALIRAKSLLKGLLGELDEARRLIEPLKTPKQSHHEIAYYLVLCAHLEFFAGNFSLSTQLYGTSIAWCQHKGFDLRGYTYSTREKNLASLCERLGDKAFQALYDEGYDRDTREILQSLGIS